MRDTETKERGMEMCSGAEATPTSQFYIMVFHDFISWYSIILYYSIP